MKTFSYVLSTTVAQELNNIDQTRRNSILELLSPRRELDLKFDNLLRIISSSLLLSGKSLSISEISNVITRGKKSSTSEDVYAIKKAYDYLNHFLFLTEDKIDAGKIDSLLKVLKPQRRLDTDNLTSIIDFVSVNPEHPVVQAALLFFLILDILPNDNNNINIATILSEAIIYKHAYDIRGMINVQEFLFSDLMNLKRKLEEASKKANLSSFIEYYVQVFSIQAEKSLKMLKTGIAATSLSASYSKLSERQIKILSLFDVPQIKISNKNVQKQFGISQITASRDLSKLASLGVIFQMGRGRSIYYVKT